MAKSRNWRVKQNGDGATGEAAAAATGAPAAGAGAGTGVAPVVVAAAATAAVIALSPPPLALTETETRSSVTLVALVTGFGIFFLSFGDWMHFPFQRVTIGWIKRCCIDPVDWIWSAGSVHDSLICSINESDFAADWAIHMKKHVRCR